MLRHYYYDAIAAIIITRDIIICRAIIVFVAFRDAIITPPLSSFYVTPYFRYFCLIRLPGCHYQLARRRYAIASSFSRCAAFRRRFLPIIAAIF